MAHDFEEIATPFIEYKEVLLGQGGETDKQVYLFEDSGGREIGLRYDLTIPFSRYVAANQNSLRIPFKKFQTGTVFRGEKPQKGRYREFVQADFDIIGTTDWRSDIEVIECLSSVLQQVLNSGFDSDYENGVNAFCFSLSHRTILAALLRKGLGLKIPGLDAVPFTLFIALDKLEKIGPQKTAELAGKALAEEGIECKDVTEIQSFFERLPELSRSTQQTKGFLQDYLHAEPGSTLHDELARFEQNIHMLTQLNVPFKVDWSIARGLGYYTGMVFETMLTAAPELGSICSGGRYDKLCSRFGKGDLPGVGGSVGVDRLLAAELWSPTKSRKVFVATADKTAQTYAMEVAALLRNRGEQVHLGVGSPKLAKQMQFAAKHGFDAVAIVGEQEMQTKSYTLKTLSTGEQEVVAL